MKNDGDELVREVRDRESNNLAFFVSSFRMIKYDYTVSFITFDLLTQFRFTLTNNQLFTYEIIKQYNRTSSLVLVNIVQWLLVIYTFASTPATSYVFSPKSLLEHVVTESSLVRIICNVFVYLHQSNLYDCFLHFSSLSTI